MAVVALHAVVKHDPEKSLPVFRQDHAKRGLIPKSGYRFSDKIMQKEAKAVSL
jgi:hypothetical protein